MSYSKTEMPKNNKVSSVIDYLGAKNKLAPDIVNFIENEIGSISGASFAELFAGTGAVSRWLLSHRDMREIVTNDTEPYSLAICMATMKKMTHPRGVYDILNSSKGFGGFITKHLSPGGHQGRMYFTTENAEKIDSMRFQIATLRNNKIITMDESIKLLGDLTIAADKVSNTASTYGAYLKKFKPSARKEVIIKPPCGNLDTSTLIYNLMLDANEVALDIDTDIVYLDPPYNNRQYCNNYHVLNYIAHPFAEDIYTLVKGITGLPRMGQRNVSKYCRAREVGPAFDELLKSIKADYIIVSYSNKGLMGKTTLEMIMGQNTEIIRQLEIPYKQYRADSNRTYDRSENIEYLYLLRKKRDCV